MVKTLINQLKNEIKANLPKAIVLGALLLVGLCMWVPPLVEAMMGDSASPAAATAAATAASTVATATPNADGETDTAKTESAEPNEFGWADAERLLQNAPLLQSVEVAAIPGDPFRINYDQFAPPVLFEEDPEDAKAAGINDSSNRQSASRVLAGLVLKSTIIGSKRRAALINGKLYFEGKDIHINELSFLLAAVYPRKVVLTWGSNKYELAIAERPRPGDIDVIQNQPDDSKRGD